MPDLGDVIRIIVEQTLLGEQVRNVYHFETTLASALDTPTDLWNGFHELVVLPVQIIQVDSLTYDNAIIENLNDELFFEEIPLAEAGSGAGVAMPSYVAYGVKLVRTFKATRNGAKRYAGVQEDNVVGNFHTLIGAQTDPITDGLATQLDVDAWPGIEGVYFPVIFRPAEEGPPEVFEFSNPVKSAQFAAPVTTQNSRKSGVGE